MNRDVGWIIQSRRRIMWKQEEWCEMTTIIIPATKSITAADVAITSIWTVARG